MGGSVVEVLSHPVSVPATAGEWEVDPEGAIFPRAEVAAVLTTHGGRAVRLALVEPSAAGEAWASGVFTATAVRQLIAVLEATLTLAGNSCCGLVPA